MEPFLFNLMNAPAGKNTNKQAAVAKTLHSLCGNYLTTSPGVSLHDIFDAEQSPDLESIFGEKPETLAEHLSQVDRLNELVNLSVEHFRLLFNVVPPPANRPGSTTNTPLVNTA